MDKVVHFEIPVDQLDRAKKFYGDESQWEKVYKPNEWRLKEEVQSGTDKLLPGTELTIKGAKFGLDGQPL